MIQYWKSIKLLLKIHKIYGKFIKWLEIARIFSICFELNLVCFVIHVGNRLYRENMVFNTIFFCEFHFVWKKVQFKVTRYHVTSYFDIRNINRRHMPKFCEERNIYQALELCAEVVHVCHWIDFKARQDNKKKMLNTKIDYIGMCRTWSQNQLLALIA